MGIPTSRTKESGSIKIIKEKCNACGLCVSVCKDFGIEIVDGDLRIAGSSIFGCIACGHCMAVCPNNAILISGRELSEHDLIDLPVPSECSSFEALNNLFVRRRSIREFKDIPVEREIIDKIISAASNAPMGIPPSDVHVLVMNGKEKVRKFAQDYCGLLKEMKWFFSPGFIKTVGSFMMSKKEKELFLEFLIPMVNAFTGRMEKGENIITYDAPAMLYFYGTEYGDPADSVIAATFAMAAAESLGLGACMLGGIHPMLQRGKPAGQFRKKHGIKHTSREGLFLILGYPAVKYNKGIKRTFAEVKNI